MGTIYFVLSFYDKKYLVGLGTLFLFRNISPLAALSIVPPVICFFSSSKKFPFSDVTMGKLRVTGILYPYNVKFSNQEGLFDDV